jgi:hypothetical protein
MKTAETR